MPRRVSPWAVALGAFAVVLGAAPRPAVAADAPGSKSPYQSTLRSVVWIVVPEEVSNHRFRAATGTGSVIDVPNRLVLTNYHVVREYREAIVQFPVFNKGKLVQEKDYYYDRLRENGIAARVLVRDPKHDLAIIQLAKMPEGTPALHLAKEGVGPGDSVHSIGNPGASGALWAYTPGSVKAVYKKQWAVGAEPGMPPMEFDAKVVETTSPLNPGDSGGPVVNDRGELVAVTHGGLMGTMGTISYLIDVSEVKALFTRYPKQLPRAPIVNPAPPGSSAEAKATGDEAAKPAAPAPDPAKEEKKRQEKTAAAQLVFAKDFLNDGKKDKARERLLKIVNEYPDTAAAKEAKDLLAGVKK